MDRYLLELNPETMKRLERLKSYPEEPFDRVINRLIDSRENAPSLTREEVEEIREALRSLREGRAQAPEPAGEEFMPSTETPASIGDPQAVMDMEMIFSGAVKKIEDRELTDFDSGDIHEIEPIDRKGRSRTPHLDSL